MNAGNTSPTAATGYAPVGYPARREHEIRHVLGDFHTELDEWSAAVLTEGPLLKHRSQVTGAIGVLRAALERVERMSAPDRSQRAPEIMLDLHHLWDFFRGKLLIRHLPRYKSLLDVSDELAWSLYEPALRAAGAKAGQFPKEPPLTFLSRRPIPFAMARGADFEPLLSHGRQRTFHGRSAAQHLPFPLIGIPWSSGRHLPALLAVAHETGHHIEDDFGLAPTLKSRLTERAGLTPQRLAHWERWLGETFADVCATTACGAAYLWTLTDALGPAGPDGEEGSGDYPPARLRALVCRAAMPPGTAGLLPPLPGEADASDDEAEAVVAALTGEGLAELDGRTPQDLFGLRRPEGLTLTVDRLLNTLPSSRGDVPGILAAATLAFMTAPDSYTERGIGERALNEVLALVAQTARADTDRDLRAQRDAASGNALFDALSGPRRSNQGGQARRQQA
ncbi:hypothetical protein [Streptomyces wuyuanensis]|uniref:Uncharacterized protein n=1 Tax=Streptomyces wuyuanensis TaxID=1196353 RepID=A0A1G9ZPU9_9ACTN|nr:hypothetical protein [Streptomyces wuyuanensis]SDN22616.1 hypothetical protein SAMN05444921_12211 [Streptomyces wuyuanensis]